jgi:hypothetical protein
MKACNIIGMEILSKQTTFIPSTRKVRSSIENLQEGRVLILDPGGCRVQGLRRKV